jgi:DNA repair exonuclease SbcCD ATPase subunit
MIHFNHIRWKNLLSTGNIWTDIQLDRSPNTLIVGENGAGKSTILDALCFVLFGKPFRKINKPQLVNSVNQKGMLVEIEFTIGKINYKIVRGMKPNCFEIFVNGKMIDQTASSRDYQKYLEDSILRLNFNSFTQIVILGSSTFIPFMQLPAQQRREIIEDLLDIKIFTAMNILLKEKLQYNKGSLNDIKFQTDLEEEKLNVHMQYVEEIKTSKEKRIDDIKAEITKAEASISKLNLSLKDSNEELVLLKDSISDESFTKKKINEIKLVESKLEDKYKTLRKDIKFYKENDTCPTCKQDIDSVIKMGYIDCKHSKMIEIEAANKKLEEQLAEWLLRIEDIQEVHKNIISITESMQSEISQVSSLQLYINRATKNMMDEQNKSGSIDLENNKIDAIRNIIAKYEKTREKLTNERQILTIANDLLKDKGIKTQIIRQYIPVMNKLVNKYLAAMEFFVSFDIDENFNEVIRSRHRDDFSYASFSEGEKMRIDLALLLTWRAIAKMKNSTNTNLLILDEVFDASLDNSGCEEFLKLIDTLGKDNNVFVISHKGVQLQDKFRSIINFEKRKNFSQISSLPN